MATSYTNLRAPDNSIVRLECHDRVESCAAIAKDHAISGKSDRYAVISEYDYKSSGDSRGVYISLLLRPSFFPSQAGLLSSLATVAIVEALSEHTTKRLGIGWVSNVYCEGKQIGGVTLEGKLDTHTAYEYIIVNFSIKLSEENFPPRLTDLVRKVFESDNNSVSTIIAKNILAKFFSFYSSMKNSEKFMHVYHQRFILSGTKIKLIDDGKKRSCKVLSVRIEDCALIVETKDKKIRHLTKPASVIIPKSIKLPKK